MFSLGQFVTCFFTLAAKLFGMKEENVNSIHEVTGEYAATLLMNPKTRRLLTPFVGAEKSIKEASQELDIKVASYYPYVKKFEENGLLEVGQTLPRAGKAVKLYRSVADEFFVPHTAAPVMAYYEKLESTNQKILWQAILKSVMENTAEASTWGMRIYKHPDIGLSAMGAWSMGEPWDLTENAGPIFLPYWRNLSLSRERAQAMQKELLGVLERYTQEQDGPDAYFLRIAMAPLPKSDER